MDVTGMSSERFRVATVLFGASVSVLAQVTPFILADQASAGSVPWKPTSLRIERIVNKAGVVTINGKRVRSGDTGLSGDLVATKKTKTEVFFPNSAQGVMLDGTSFSLGKNCIQLDKSAARQRILLSGVSSVCFGNNTKANTNQTVLIVEQDPQLNYTVAVLAGNVGIDGSKDTFIAEDYDINKRFPAVAPSFGVGASGFFNAFPSSGGLVLATANTFVPLSQQRAASMLYSYSAVGSNFDGFTGISTELGYRWLAPANQSSTSVYVGYSGFDSPSCFSNLVNLGAGWERLRWRFGATAGLNTGGCQAGFSFGALNISAPIATFEKTRVAYLSLTPYLLWGDNILTAGYYDGTSGSVAPGARLSLLAPITENLSLNAYGALDTVYGATVGGTLKFRFPVGGRVIRDPNLQVAQASTAPVGGVDSPISAVADGFEIPEAYKARFTANGDRIGGTEKIRPEEFIGFVTDYLQGIAPLAESHRVARVAAKHGALTAKVASILGSEFLETASRPVSETAQQPFDVTYFPTASYSCVASDSAKAYAEQRLRADNNPAAADRVAAANSVYLGPGVKVSNGWPITTSPANAYRFGNESACRQLNTIIERDSNYQGPPNPVGTVILR
jgi:hypothetical protein